MLARYETQPAHRGSVKQKVRLPLIIELLKAHKPNDMSNDQMRQVKQYFDGAIFVDIRTHVSDHLGDYNTRDTHQGLRGKQFLSREEELKQQM